jgi:hypothetical protein
MDETGMRKKFRRLLGIGLLGFWLLGPATSVGRGATGKSSGTDGSEQPQPAIACTIESLPAEVVEEAPFEVTIAWSLPASSGQVRLNCELKGEGIDVLQAQRPMVGGTGKQQLRFRALRRSQAKHIVLACWLGTDWRQPLVPIHFARPISILSQQAAEKRQRDQAEARDCSNDSPGSRTTRATSPCSAVIGRDRIAPSSTPSPRPCARQVTSSPCSMRRPS